MQVHDSKLSTSLVYQTDSFGIFIVWWQTVAAQWFIYEPLQKFGLYAAYMFSSALTQSPSFPNICLSYKYSTDHVDFLKLMPMKIYRNIS